MYSQQVAQHVGTFGTFIHFQAISFGLSSDHQDLSHSENHISASACISVTAAWCQLIAAKQSRNECCKNPFDI
jgi:hypothetical protein